MPHPDCIVYLDSLTRNPDGTLSAYIDFRREEDVAVFKAYSPANMEFDESRTFIRLESFRATKRLVHDCYYKLNLELLNQCKQYPAAAEGENAGIVGRTYYLAQMPVPADDSTELLQSHEPLDPDEMLCDEGNLNISLSQIPKVDLTLIVRDVAQANWNELLAGDKIVVSYDLGARMDASAAEVREVFENRREKYEQDKPVLVLSHWDIDHYHCLVKMDEGQIANCFSKCVCVNKITSVSGKRVYDKLQRGLGNANVCCLIPPAHTDGIQMHHWRNFGNLSIYQGEASRNRNFCGLSLFVRGDGKSANLTGDLKLKQAKSTYDIELAGGIGTDEHILVAPHHGGDYGLTLWEYSAPTTEVVISVGAGNRYGHPESAMLAYLNGLCGRNIKRTDVGGEVVEAL